MANKFKEGFVFGAGFAVAFTIISIAADFAISPVLLDRQLQQMSLPRSVHRGPGDSEASMRSLPPALESRMQFHDLTPEEQIKTASVIAVTEFEKQADGKMAAIIKEFLKKDPDAVTYYEVGDEFPDMSYYPAENTSRGDGAVIFFVGSPATMQMSMSYYGNRISGLGDMPLETFKGKCTELDDKAG